VTGFINRMGDAAALGEFHVIALILMLGVGWLVGAGLPRRRPILSSRSSSWTHRKLASILMRISSVFCWPSGASCRRDIARGGCLGKDREASFVRT